MNDALIPEGLVPSLLVFGEYPKQSLGLKHLLIVPKPLDVLKWLTQRDKKYVSKQIALLRVQRALRHAVPPSFHNFYQPGDQVLVWRENVINNRIGEWLKHFIVEHFDPQNKLVYLRNTKIRNYRLSMQLKSSAMNARKRQSHFIFRYSKFLPSFCNTSSRIFVHLTEIIELRDPRSSSNKMEDAK